MLTIHRLRGTWNTHVDAYVALSEFARAKFVAGGLPEDRLFVKPNCLTPDPGLRTSSAGFALYVGRLSGEKGIETLVAGWSHLRHRKLKIIGNGPLRPAMEAMQHKNIEFLGARRHPDVLEFIGKAAFLVMPSECYENFPRVIVEAFARGVPVLASRIGSMQEIIRDNCTGVLFRPGDSHDLANKAEWLFSHSRDVERMSKAARSEFLEKYTAGRNYERLMEIYALATEHSRQRYAKSVAVPSPASGIGSSSS
jgi:glycosyltransferase involved in cell wall biosynthesis